MWRFEALCKVPILFSLTDTQLYELARCMKYQTLQANQLVFKKGDPGKLGAAPSAASQKPDLICSSAKSSCMQSLLLQHV